MSVPHCPCHLGAAPCPPILGHHRAIPASRDRRSANLSAVTTHHQGPQPTNPAMLDGTTTGLPALDRPEDRHGATGGVAIIAGGAARAAAQRLVAGDRQSFMDTASE